MKLSLTHSLPYFWNFDQLQHLGSQVKHGICVYWAYFVYYLTKQL